MTTILEKTAGLIAFVRTVESGSFSSASRQVGASPSAVSKSVARLEARMGVRLFQRSTRSLRLTPEGSAYYERVAPLLRAIEEADDVVQDAASARGLLRVTAPQLFGRVLVAAWADAFVARHPLLKLELSVTDRNVDLVREGYDVALRMGPLPDTTLVGRALTDLQTVLVASPNYLRRRGAPQAIADLQQHACLRFLLGGRPYPFSFADGTVVVPEGPIDTDDGGALQQAAVHGAGIAHLVRFAVADDLAQGRLVQVLPQLAMPSMPVHVLHAFGRQLPVRARLFVDFVVERVAALDVRPELGLGKRGPKRPG